MGKVRQATRKPLVAWSLTGSVLVVLAAALLLLGLNAGGGRFRGNAGGRITGQVGAGSPQRLQQHRALQRRQPERAGQRPVLLEPPRQPAPHPGVRVTGLVTWRCARANRSS